MQINAPTHPAFPAPRRGFTLVEVLVAMAVSIILILSVTAAFIQVIRASDEATASTNAHTGARSAADIIANELREIRLDNTLAFQEMVLIDRPLIYGDGIDNDGDGSVDEEIFNGFDTDGDWTSGIHDIHAQAVGSIEREPFFGFPDYGDQQVDEDCLFSADEISFIVPGTPRSQVTYSIGTFEGQEHVLLRTVRLLPTDFGVGGTVTVEPVAFDVVSLDILAWNSNQDAVGPVVGQPYWVGEWVASTKVPPLAVLNGPTGIPPFKLPAAFLVSVTVNAETEELANLGNWSDPNRPLKTVTATTVVTVESITNDTRYFQFIRD